MKNGELLAFIIAMADLSEAIKIHEEEFYLWLSENFMGNENFKKVSTFVGRDSSQLSKQRSDAVLATMLFGSALKLGIQKKWILIHYEKTT